MKFFVIPNSELEGWDIVEKDGIQSEEGFEDSIVATFYEHDKALSYANSLNQ